MTDFAIYCALDGATLRRRIENEEFTLRKFQAHAELVNKILDRVSHGTIDEYCTEWSNAIRESNTRLEIMRVALAMKGI